MGVKSMKTEQLIDLVSKRLEDLGYNKRYVWGSSYSAMRSIQKYHRQCGTSYYDPAITAEFMKISAERYANGEFRRAYWNFLRKAAERLDDFFLTGDLSWKRNSYKPPIHLCDEFACLLEKFMNSRLFHENTRCDFVWVLRKYLLYLQEHGFQSFSDISLNDVRLFMLDTSQKVSLGSLSNIQCYIRKFHIFLAEQEIPAPDCIGLLSYRIPRDVHVKNYVTDEELEKILQQIDTDTSLGKRDMAIILLGATTGLRAIDIVHLELSDINWRTGEIHIIQSKTQGHIYLPLVKCVGDALIDYILNSRPESNSSKIFLRSQAPFTGLESAATVGYMFNRYLKKAGIQRCPFDGKTFHGFRRRIGHNLLHSGVPLTTISQILGHRTLSATEQYLSLDSDILKKCALDLKNIEPRRKES